LEDHAVQKTKDEEEKSCRKSEKK